MIKPETNINLLKIKKCAKEYFNIYSLYNFNIKYLYLFDTPIYIKSLFNLNLNNLTINLNGLEYYSDINNFN